MNPPKRVFGYVDKIVNRPSLKRSGGVGVFVPSVGFRLFYDVRSKTLDLESHFSLLLSSTFSIVYAFDLCVFRL